MSIGLLLVGLGILLCAAALVTTVILAATAGRSKRKIMEKMEKKY